MLLKWARAGPLRALDAPGTCARRHGSAWCAQAFVLCTLRRMLLNMCSSIMRTWVLKHVLLSSRSQVCFALLKLGRCALAKDACALMDI